MAVWAVERRAVSFPVWRWVMCWVERVVRWWFASLVKRSGDGGL